MAREIEINRSDRCLGKAAYPPSVELFDQLYLHICEARAVRRRP